ncbi:MAG: hypothetical protein KAS38_11450 [Anaerolineales bacterium]|nr:hypothetical protein [Anaerolineales bacterium]
MLILLAIIAFTGGLIALFAGRWFYPIWLGFVTFLFSWRIFDLALFQSSDIVRTLGSLVVAALVTALVIRYRDRAVKIVPALGGFLVSAAIAERLLEFLHPEAGKFLVGGVLVAGPSRAATSLSIPWSHLPNMMSATAGLSCPSPQNSAS